MRETEYLKHFAKNLLRKINFIGLHSEVEDKIISEEEFDRELDENWDKYTITMSDEKVSHEEMKIVLKLASEFSVLQEFSVDEVAMFFGVNPEQIMESMHE